jgi:ribonucleotide monophosphatase NagD (HAD superfamily)
MRQLNLAAAHVMMVGDDIDSDVGGAQQTGLKAILVRTGKYRQEYAASSPIRPDGVINSVADLIGCF